MIRETLVISLVLLVGAGWAYWILAWICTRVFMTRCTVCDRATPPKRAAVSSPFAEEQGATPIPGSSYSLSPVLGGEGGGEGPGVEVAPLPESPLSLTLSPQYRGEGTRIHPRVSILKPIKGIDAYAYENFSTFAKQDYDNYEILFAVLDPNDPAVPEIHRLQQDFPHIPIRLFIAERLGVNPKCANLHRLVAESTADVLVLSDADIRVTADYLSRVIAPLADPSVGLVTCPYRGLLARGFPARLESLHMEVVFLPSVVLAHRLGQRVAMGATLALRRSDLLRTGGFAAIADHLMDDYQLATLIEGLGLKTHLSDYVVESVIGRSRFSDQWAREVRWCRGIRVTCPGKYWGLLVTYPTAWALALCATGLRPWTLAVFAGTLFVRWIIASDVETLLGGAGRDNLPLLPVRDMLSFLTWCAGVVGNRIVWRGQDFVIRRDGRLCAKSRDVAVPNRRVRLGGRVLSAPSSPDASAKADPTETFEGSTGFEAWKENQAMGVSSTPPPLHRSIPPPSPSRGMFSRLVRRLDRFLRRQEGIFEYSTDTDCMLRVSLGRCDVDVMLSDGAALAAEDGVCDLHLFNDHIPTIGPDGAGIAWANQVQRGVRKSLIKLAAVFESDPRFAEVKAVRCQTIFVTGRGIEQLQRFMARLNLESRDPVTPPSRLKRLHDLGENLLLWALVWTFNPGGLRNAKLMRERHWFYMSRQTLLSRYSTIPPVQA